MATGTGKRSTSGKGTSAKSGTASGKSTQGRSGGRKNNAASQRAQESAITNEIVIIGIFAVVVFLFLCNFHIIGKVGDAISAVMFGLLGIAAYMIPILVFLAVIFGLSNPGNTIAKMKLAAGIVLIFLIGIVLELMSGSMKTISENNHYGEVVKYLYEAGSQNRVGGGVLFGTFAYILHRLLSMTGTIFVVITLGIIAIVVLTEKSFLSGVKKGSRRVYETAREKAAAHREEMRILREEQEEEWQRELDEQEADTEAAELEKRRRMDKHVSGVMLDTKIVKKGKGSKRGDMHEITLPDASENTFDFDKIHIRGIHIPENDAVTEDFYEGIIPAEEIPKPIDVIQERPVARVAKKVEQPEQEISFMKKTEITRPEGIRPRDQLGIEPMEAQAVVQTAAGKAVSGQAITAQNAVSATQLTALKTAEEPVQAKPKIPKKYVFPPTSLLKKGQNKGNSDSTKLLKETAMRLQQTLATFGVRVTITDISQGPSVTRYEMQPEQGVKVSKIVGLADDIKLNLAATDIRIEAPIPGKAAVGIEVPNKENSAVAFRDLIESKEFKEFPSLIAFAVGKDIAGQTVVADIGKMPHMLIAGATGSGKSVCINTLIMSIIYKAHPDDVKLIMIDPKVVELNVYNGIPHLLIPVVTDPKKAAGALHWGVAEMEDRYRKFADLNVRDLKGYNKKVEGMSDTGEYKKLPQIIIIVDELADLMMVAPGEVEESICRLAQLARAAGIHLIIATQRPSVDVITGLIKANMPSRVAFSVSSGVDSRTILDMNGAEKLLGKGDMLFYPQGYSKPARIQGAFVSDKEVSDVVDYLKNQAIGNTYSEDVEEKIVSIGTASGAGGLGGGEERDAYFADAGKFIIDKDKASIGMLQRVFKVGFNRAARIMDQLADAGVVGEEEGTKPRKVLMSMEEFLLYIEESL